MKDPQQHNHQAWQASPYGRSWQAEASTKANNNICHRDTEVRREKQKTFFG
jgi:hypothetical protein